MCADGELALRSIQLKTSEQWHHKQGGLSFIFAHRGIGDYSCRSVVQPLAPGDLLVRNDARMGRLSPRKGGEFLFSVFSISFEQLLPLFEGAELSLLPKLAERFKTIRFYECRSSLAAECHRLIAELPQPLTLAHRSQLVRVAASILTDELKTAKSGNMGSIPIADQIREVFDHLSLDEILRLSVGELAGRFGCSRRHLNRRFHEFFGLCVSALRIELRLLKAASLLRDPEAKVCTVADASGFNNVGHFNCCFKKRFGASPGRWRKLPVLGREIGGGIPKRQWHLPVLSPTDRESAGHFRPASEMAASAKTEHGPTTPARFLLKMQEAHGLRPQMALLFQGAAGATLRALPDQPTP